ncbi:GH15 family glucan-1,4-alpha-glucosidase [Pseudomonas citronellolis]|uniref:glycoside hydrolase family 15 protein n=1 Tax=Pseudomonas citronellolis TaxID=53408 RepID=UPI0020A147C0|nr:glycoside hydrolase family 15 protein [Pseudomonas citronellolis]MCP1645447.1 GH15 family glucan-1,4-alpha-glucosidase [Pseudomonas citronellolis]MCP1668288.1 GH15 family glucan-1,4-alpha-glucosidase [Pseudomonas citronellolis]MCP1700775.1 GH15 family glucan-1,4-alpha-glucosidase [Pseudomonas citronellolis]MCP1706345.1 GH15 family glucan-1,4-alpha-glucosidase [Pseudomonas citronellolis]MCP1796660.1 GH15 family glucan-1,4-alpha-glucosidase [Pseudomonas citronellolis]
MSKHNGALDLGLIGNCRVAALVNRQARLVWWCYPNFDGDPAFSRLLAGDEEKGFCDVLLDGMVSSHSEYQPNTAIIRTTLTDAAGNAVRITDFAPRFLQYGRYFRPAQLCRLVEPVQGLPRVTLRMRPTHHYGKPCEAVAGSSHIRYLGGDQALRLTTDAPLSYVMQETPFALKHPVSLVMGVDEPLDESPEQVVRSFLERTRAGWYEWVRSLAIPFEWQDVVIRAAITLKLCSFEETGAIIAAVTTSVPEAPGTQRNWDYRYCWLRDAYFVVLALNRLGATKTMERYVDFITTVAVEGAELRPLYGVVPAMDLSERIEPDLAGFLGHAPVRVGNQAVEQVQHDVFGSVVLAVLQSFVDQRLPHPGDEGMLRMLESLAERAARNAFVPDAGIWEYRGRQRVHTHSAMLCWAACDRVARIAARLGHGESAARWRKEAMRIREGILREAWSERRQSFTGSFGVDDLDASVLLMHELGLIEADDPRFVATVDCIGRELNVNGHLLRYAAADDFGVPETAFLVVKFWYLDALAAIGRRDQARELYAELLAARNSFGLLSEDLHPHTGEMWGNIPQTYSMAGLINTAMRLSMSWEEGLCRGL